MLDDPRTSLRVFLLKDRLSYPIRNLVHQGYVRRIVGAAGFSHLVTELDDGCDVICSLPGLGLSRPLQALQGPNLLVQRSLHERQLPCQFKGVNIQQLEFLRRLRYYGRWGG